VRAPALSAGDIVDGRFEVVTSVRRGGSVYRAIDRHQGDRIVALKVPRGLRDKQRWLQDATSFQRLNHPRVVAHLGHGVWRTEEPYVVVEWLEGVDLEQLLRERALSVTESVRAGIAVAEALEHAHARNVVHGQLRPGHVFLVDEEVDRLVLVDFLSGSAPAVDRSDDSGALVEAMAYMAPEQTRGVVGTREADAFSLGCLLYRIIGGRLAFDASSMGAVVMSLLESEPLPLASLVSVPQELDALVRALLAKDPVQRPDVAATRLALMRIAGGLEDSNAPTALHECPPETVLSEYLEGLLVERERDVVEVHLDSCPSCSQLVGAYARAHLGDSEPPPSVAAASLGIGATLGRYRIRNVVGMGGVGIVYLAVDLQLERKVALKLLLDVQRGERARQRMLREARALAQLAHPNIVAVYDAGFFGQRPYLVMEYVPGLRLDVWMKETGRTREEVVAALFQVGEGLSAAHDAGLVHRDVKPANVIVGDDGRTRVLDFGLVRFDAPDRQVGFRTTAGAFLGTPYYMPPEQSAGEEVDARADQFSFCVMLFDALYRGGRPHDPRFGAPEIPDPNDGVLKVIDRGLMPRPEQRYPHMQTLLSELRAAFDAERERRNKSATLPLPFHVPPSSTAEVYVLIARPPSGLYNEMPLSELTHTLVPDENLTSPGLDAARELAERAGGRVALLPDGLLTARFRNDRERLEPPATRAVQCALAFLGVLGVRSAAVIADDAPGGELTLAAIDRAEELLRRTGNMVRVDERVAADISHEMRVEKDGLDWIIRR
jgi:serine/threonine-protein kinase